MGYVWLYTLLSVIAISLVSFAGVFIVSIREKLLRWLLPLLICFAIGTLLGNSFFHLLPVSYASIENSSVVSWLVLGGFMLFFVIEEMLHRNASHTDEIKTYGYLSLYTDAIHNFTDGILVAASWMVSPELGFSTTLAILFHEIPHEICDFGVLIKAGFKTKRALFYNFLVACTAILGAILTLWIGHAMESLSTYIIPIAAGGFIYLGAANLLPDIIHSSTNKNRWLDFVVILLGLFAMFLISQSGVEGHVH